MMICYAILASKASNQLRLLIERLNSSNSFVLVHYDAKSDVRDLERIWDFANFELTRKRYCVYWGGFSMVKATLQLFEDACKKGADRICLLSESCWPVKSNAEVENHLNKEYDYISIGKHEIDENHRFYGRLSQYHMMDSSLYNPKCKGVDEYESKIIKEFLNDLPLRDLPSELKFYAGPNWMSLRKETFYKIDSLLSRYDNKFDFFKWSAHPDESFFQTAIMTLYNMGEYSIEELMPNLHYADFSRRGRVLGLPKVLDESDIERVEVSQKFFARKVVANVSDKFCMHFRG